MDQKPIILYNIPSSLSESSDDCDCDTGDCSCENQIRFHSTDFNPKAKWSVARKAYPLESTLSWIPIYNPDGPIALSAINKAAFDIWESFREERSIASSDYDNLETIQLMANIGLIHQLRNRLAVIESFKTLSAWIHLTNVCNLRCDYCYLSKDLENMSDEIGMDSINSVFQSAHQHHYQSVKLKYAGGEPLINFNLLKKMHLHAKLLSERYGIQLKEVVLSNGTLLRNEHIDFLKNEDIRLSISLDGIGSVHDNQRRQINGKGTFDKIERNLRDCRNKDFSPDITITITHRNADKLSELVSFLLFHDLHFNFNFYRENDCSMSWEDLKLGEGKIINGLYEAYRVIEKNLPAWSLLGALGDRSSFIAVHSHACSVGRDYLVIDHHGQVTKCQMTIGLPLTSIYSEDPLMDIRNDKAGIQNISVEEKEGCKTCEWKNWCAGGCPLATYRATGRYDIKSPNCNIYKAIYPEILRLESLRLIKFYKPV